MLLLSQRLLDKPVMSLQTGAEIAHTKSAVIDPSTLQVVGYYVESKVKKESPLLLKTEDIREVSQIGLIIDSIDEILPEADLLRMQEITKLSFAPTNLSVIDEKQRKLGKVVDYGVDPTTFTIHQLHVKQPLFKSFHVAEMIINRTQIVEINDKNIVVKEASDTSSEELSRPVLMDSTFANPFRKPQIDSRDSS